MKPKAIFIKLGITLTLVAILGYMVDFGELRRSIAAVSARALLTAVLGYALTQVITSTKWYVLLQAAGVKCTLSRTIKAVFIGMYVNTFCFGTIGGDLVRSLLVSGNSADKGISLASVVADRVMGLSVLAGIGILSGLFFGSISEQPDIALVATAFIVLAGLGWLYAPLVIRTAAGLMPPRWSERLSALERAFPHDKSVLGRVIGLATIYHLSQIAVIGMIIKEVGGSVPWSYLLFAVPFINIVSTLPLSWMGLGVRETAYVLFFAPHYLTRENALLIGVIWLLGMTITSAVGGILAALSGDYNLLKTKGPTDIESS